MEYRYRIVVLTVAISDCVPTMASNHQGLTLAYNSQQSSIQLKCDINQSS